MLLGAEDGATNSYNNYNPSLTANLRMAVSQPLLQNRGSYVNHIPLMMAQANYKQSTYALSQPVADAGEQRRNGLLERGFGPRDLARAAAGAGDAGFEFLKYMQQQLDLGAISPLDIFNPRSQRGRGRSGGVAGAIQPGPGGRRAAQADRRGPRSGHPQVPLEPDRIGGNPSGRRAAGGSRTEGPDGDAATIRRLRQAMREAERRRPVDPVGARTGCCRTSRSRCTTNPTARAAITIPAASTHRWAAAAPRRA